MIHLQVLARKGAKQLKLPNQKDLMLDSVVKEKPCGSKVCEHRNKGDSLLMSSMLD